MAQRIRITLEVTAPGGDHVDLDDLAAYARVVLPSALDVLGVDLDRLAVANMRK